MDEHPSVLVTIPNTGWVHRSVVEVLMKLGRSPVNMQLSLPQFVPLENAQHHIIAKILKSDYDFWLNLDSDTAPMNDPLELLDLDLDMIGLPYPLLLAGKPGERPISWAAWDYVEEEDGYAEHLEKQGLQKVDAVGGGCFLIKCDVFRKHPELQSGAFARTLNSNGTVQRGNDISFCERLRSVGIQIHAHYDYPCKHFKEVDLARVNSGFRELMDAIRE